jgi:hypothetical protein
MRAGQKIHLCVSVATPLPLTAPPARARPLAFHPQHLLERGLVVKNATAVTHAQATGVVSTKHTFLLHHRRFAPAVRLGPSATLQARGAGGGYLCKHLPCPQRRWGVRRWGCAA